ncbi:unnamed protein product [Macrosiphum euphorbiae]|uniref:Uncharacterized protein n=1 Tax=Macrosiphum euphorbiae TaxID=13131 RepID=A0AAV0XGV6_9HEMI|nr:unnamed protein product [Macrosiphum euphorbiae]
MCGCLSSKVEKDSSAHCGDRRYHYCERWHRNCTARSHRFAADTGAGGDTDYIVHDNYDSGRRDSGNDGSSCDSFIGDSGGNRQRLSLGSSRR